MAGETGGVGVRADLYEPLEDGVVRCTACAHGCRLSEGQTGICRVRTNVDGELRLLTYGSVYDPTPGPPGTPDPVEKKPLYQFKPGTRVLSFGGASCNFRCQFCQNYRTAFASPDELGLRQVSPDDAVRSAAAQDCAGVAWTYNEPTIYAEYVRDAARAASEAGLYTVLVTNGYFTEQCADELAPHLDAANVDIKGFRDRQHARYMGARLEPTLRGAEYLVDRGVHVELTYLVIPDLNDDEAEIAEFAAWAADLDASVPVHFTRFHPDFQMRDRPPTPVETLDRARDIAMDAGLEFVYVGNVPGHEGATTACPDCGDVWVRRSGFTSTVEVNLDGTCACGRAIDVVP